MDGNSLMFCGIEHSKPLELRTRKLCDQMALAVKGRCKRLREEERKCLEGLLSAP